MGLDGNGGRHNVAHLGFRHLRSVALDGNGGNSRGVCRESACGHGYHGAHGGVGYACLDSGVQHFGHGVHIQGAGLQTSLDDTCHFLHKSLVGSGGFNLVNSRSGCRRSSLLSHTGEGARKRKCQRTERRLCHEPGFHKRTI